MPSPSLPSESLLVFSDVHLGSDLHEGAENRSRRSVSVDRDLVRLLAHYRAEKPSADRWRIVIAGDFIDFIGIAIPADAAHVTTEPTEEERVHGLGSAVDHARWKLARVGERHADVFRELAEFVAAGHALSVVHGNHDIELHWDDVKADFRALLAAHAEAAGVVDRDSFQARIEFHPWFFYRDGVAFIEHGHQYDPFCATEHIMAPVSPVDPRRIARGFCDTLIRFVVRTTRGLKEHGHETVGLGHYLAFGARLGVGGMIRLAVNFARAVREMFHLRRAHLSEAARALRIDHEARVAKLAAATKLGVDRLRALLSLQTPPITRTIRGILGGVLLDRLAVGMTAVIALIALVVVGGIDRTTLSASGAVLAAWLAAHVYLSRRRVVDPRDQMAERAAHVARLFPAAFVVMGHTHVAAAVPAGDATYVNVGSWAEDADAEEVAAATRTHLVIEVRGDRPEARFCVWEDSGPRPRTLPPPA